MILYDGHKVTATEIAKLLVEDKGATALEFWGEFSQVDWDRLTEREKLAVNEAIEKQLERVRKLFNFWDLYDDVRARPTQR
jgi:hypothetical protein